MIDYLLQISRISDCITKAVLFKKIAQTEKVEAAGMPAAPQAHDDTPPTYNVEVTDYH